MKNNLEKLGNKVIIFLLSFLLVLWFLGSTLSLHFATINQTLTSLGQIFGLTGFLLLCFVIILKSRLSFFEKYFGGMNQIYKTHHKLGGIAFILIMFHPVFLTIKYLLISTQSAAMFLLPRKDIYITSGIIAFLFMSLFLIITFYFNLPYHLWKKTHGLMAIVFVVAFFHSFFIYSDLLINLPLKLYVGFFAVAGISSATYQILMKYNLINKKIYEVVETNDLTDRITEIEFKPKGAHLNFIPGQFVFVNFKSKFVSKESHPFTMTSNPKENTLKLAIKNLGDYTEKISLLKNGDLAYFEGPFGYFSQERHPNNYQLWIAGGIGITPFISMVRSLNDKKKDIYLYYTVHTKDEHICVKELKKIEQDFLNLHIIFYCSNEKGRLSAKILNKEVPNLEKREIFICGPGKMMPSFREQLVALNIKNGSIHTEEFDL